MSKAREHLWPIDRLVLAEKITWTEAETIISMEEILDFNETFDAWHDATHSEEQIPKC